MIIIYDMIRYNAYSCSCPCDCVICCCASWTGLICIIGCTMGCATLELVGGLVVGTSVVVGVSVDGGSVDGMGVGVDVTGTYGT
jgi:hypothetical protein